MQNRFESQLAKFEQDHTLVFCGSSILDKDSNTLKVPEFHDDILMSLIFKNPFYHPTVMIKKDILLKHAYNNAMVPSEDYDLWSRLIFEGCFYQIQEPLLYVRRHQTSVTANRRKEQLQHNIEICTYILKQLRFNIGGHYDESLRIFYSHDYTASGRQLRTLVQWIHSLKQTNIKMGRFSIEKFNNMADSELKHFLISYFRNQKLRHKIIPFMYLSPSYKTLILNYYFNKLFKTS
jgi:hypothetical protein